MFPELNEWSKRDMFTADPHREGFWSYQGRVDDLILLSNGGSENPSGYEARLSGVPFVKQAIMCGTGKPGASLLVELIDSSTHDLGQLEELWKVIAECNNLFPPQSSVPRSRIIIVSSDKPFPRSPKGSIQRASALEMYSTEISQVYQES